MKSEVGHSFSRENINYSMVWEDPHLLLKSLPENNNPEILSIGSAGCNTLSLLSIPGSKVTAIDMSLPQIHLLELKKTAIEHLSRTEFLNLFGYTNNETPLSILDKIVSKLSPSAQKFWAGNHDLIQKGLIHCGKLESYFQKFQHIAIKNLFSQEEIDFLVKNQNLEQQKELIQKRLPEIKIRISEFFNRKNFSQEGRSEAQYKYVDQQTPIEVHLIQRTLKALEVHLVSQNPYLHYIFTGSFTESLLPDHLNPESFQKIKNNIHNLRLVSSDLESLLQDSKSKFNFFNLSDIFEYVSEEHFEKLLVLLKESSSKESRIAYWNLFVDRTPTEGMTWTRNDQLSNKLHQIDRVWFYKSFNVLELN